MPRLQVYNQKDAPSPRLGHAAAIHGDKMYIFGGHTVSSPNSSQEISNELFTLDLTSMQWQRVQVSSQNMVQPLAYMAYTTVIEDNLLAVFGGLS